MSHRSPSQFDLSLIPQVPITPFVDPVMEKHGVKLSVLRLDHVDAVGSGNKYFKLLKHLEFIQQNNIQTVVSFGGAYSNHLHALSEACAELNKKRAVLDQQDELSTQLQFIAYVAESKDNSLSSIASPTLLDIQQQGAQIQFISRSQYRRRYDAAFHKEIQQSFPQAHIIAEGAADALGQAGADVLGQYIAQRLEMLEATAEPVTHVVLACGTSSTFIGVLNRLPADYSLLGVPALKAKYFQRQLESGLTQIQRSTLATWSIDDAPQNLAYGEVNDVLIQFAEHCLNEHDLPLDPVYNVKLICRLLQKIEAGEYRQGSHILAIHSGGLQGCRGVENWPVGYNSLSSAK